MDRAVYHDWSAETPEAKVRWFRSLSVTERLDVFCDFTDLVLAINPRLMESKPHAAAAPGRVQVLSRT